LGETAPTSALDVGRH